MYGTGACVPKKKKNDAAFFGSLRAGFTLFEVLITIAVLSVLIVFIVVILDPIKYIREARDTNRLVDLTALNKILTYSTSGALGTVKGFAEPLVVYVSIPDKNATTTYGTDCTGMGLPQLPAGYSYHCAHPDTYRNIDGTGWIPLNFKPLRETNPISQLPADPLSRASSRHFFTYMSDNGWKLTARLESPEIMPRAGTDGGIDPTLFEVGTNLALGKFLGGMVGRWNFEESGAVVFDGSGFGNNGTSRSDGAPADIHSTDRCRVGKSCAILRDDKSYVDIAPSDSQNNDYATFTAWVELPDYLCAGDDGIILSKTGSYEWGVQCKTGWQDLVAWPNGGTMDVRGKVPPNRWTFIAASWDGQKYSFYVNGSLQSDHDMPFTGPIRAGDRCVRIGARNGCSKPSGLFRGRLDDVRLYDHALTGAQIRSLYNAYQSQTIL